MRALAVVGALVLSLLASTAALAEPNDGSVSGQVVNKTSGGGSTGGVSMQLVSFGRKEQAPLGQQTTTTDANGQYSFSGLDRDPNLVYLVIARYGDISYPAESPFQLVESPQHADVPVYESTSDDSALQLERLNLLVLGADQGTLQLMQMGAIVNNGDRTFVTANPQDQQLARALKFALPNGALDAQMQTGFDQRDVIPAVGGIQVTTPVLPGRHEFALSFELPYSGSSADLSVQVPYPTAAFNVYLPGGGMRLDSSDVAASGNASLGGQQYALYTASNVPRTTIVASSLSGLSGARGGLDSGQLALISLTVVLIVLGGGILLMGVRGRPAAAAGSASKTGSLEQERLELVVRLAALDERFAAGEVPEADYEADRAHGMQRLRELLLLRRKASPTS
jgi:hypothetical protein